MEKRTRRYDMTLVSDLCLTITPYLVLNVHWARLLICASERRQEKEERRRKRKKEEKGRKENVQEKTAEDVKDDGGKGRETER